METYNNLALHFKSKNFVPVFSAYSIPYVGPSSEIQPTVCDPSQFSLKRIPTYLLFQSIIGKNKVIDPETKSATITAGVAQLTFNQPAAAIGFKLSFDTGDQTPVGIISVTLTGKDDAGASFTQSYTFKTASKNTESLLLFGTYKNDVVHPLVASISATNAFVIDFTGPNSTGISVETLSGKHPLVNGMLNSSLLPKLMKYEAEQK